MACACIELEQQTCALYLASFIYIYTGLYKPRELTHEAWPVVATCKVFSGYMFNKIYLLIFQVPEKLHLGYDTYPIDYSS